jgi:hypothetical protein
LNTQAGMQAIGKLAFWVSERVTRSNNSSVNNNVFFDKISRQAGRQLGISTSDGGNKASKRGSNFRDCKSTERDDVRCHKELDLARWEIESCRLCSLHPRGNCPCVRCSASSVEVEKLVHSLRTHRAGMR